MSRAGNSDTTGIRELLQPLLDIHIAGGCDECADPYQVTTEQYGHLVLTVHHDDDCPRLARYRRGRGA